MLKTILFYTGSVCVYKKSSIHIKRKVHAHCNCFFMRHPRKIKKMICYFTIPVVYYKDEYLFAGNTLL